MQILRLRSFSRPITTLVLSILLLIVASPTFTSSTEIIANTEEELMEVFRNAKFVEQLDSRTFDATLRKTKYVLVEFYAPWCGHCIQFEPTYRHVAQSFQSFHPDISITVGKVDATKERALASRFNVRGYPSFFLIDGWNVYAYNGPRTRIEMVKWVAETHKNDEVSVWIRMSFLYHSYLLAKSYSHDSFPLSTFYLSPYHS